MRKNLNMDSLEKVIGGMQNPTPDNMDNPHHHFLGDNTEDPTSPTFANMQNPFSTPSNEAVGPAGREGDPPLR